MRTPIIPGALLLLLCMASLGETQTKTEAAPDVDAKRIGELIQKLGSADAKERGQAQKDLEVLGPQALEQLREAARLGENAGDVARKIEEKIYSAKLLTPKRIRLKVEDVSVQEAVAEMAKLSGYPIQLVGDKGEGKKITLDTGEVSFWEALDQLCDKAGLTTQTFLPGAPPGGIGNPPVPLPVPVKPPVINPGDRPPDAPPPPKGIDKDTPKKELPPKGKGLEGLKLEPKPVERPVPVAPPPDQVPPPLPLQPVAPGQVPPPAVQPPPPPPLQPIQPFAPIGRPGQIILQPKFPGAAKAIVSYSGAVRVQVNPTAGPKGEYQLMFSVAAEPRLQSFSVQGSPTVTKAEDDQGQQLATAANPAGLLPGPAGLPMPSPMMPGGSTMTYLRLKAGEKEAKSLKELSGTLSAQVMAPAGVSMRVDNVMKAAGETVKGKKGGSLELTSIEKTESGEIKVQCKVVKAMPEAGLPIAPVHPGITNNLPELLDAKGNAFQFVRTVNQKFSALGGAPAQELTLLYRGDKGQGDPESLVISDMRRLTISIPFSFQNVPLAAPGPRLPVAPVPPVPVPPAPKIDL